MRTESISMGTVPRVAVLQLRNSEGTGGGEELFNIEGLTSPDDMRSHSRASLRSVSDRNRSVWVNGWTAVGLTVFGMTSLAASAYITLFDKDFNVVPPPKTGDDYLRCAAGATMALVSSILVATGLKHACRCVRACRGDTASASRWPAPPVTLDTEVGASDRI